MRPRLRATPSDSRALSPTGWVILFVVFVGGTVAVAVFFAPYDTVRPASPVAEWEWDTSAETISLSHEGGDTVDRASLTIKYGENLTETIPNLGAEDDDRISHPFGDTTVSQGDTLVLHRDSIDGGTIALWWEKPDGPDSATLAQYEEPVNASRPADRFRRIGIVP